MEFEEGEIIRRNNKWFVYTKDGKKKLGGPYDTYKEALKRLRSIEYWKRHETNNE